MDIESIFGALRALITLCIHFFTFYNTFLSPLKIEFMLFLIINYCKRRNLTPNTEIFGKCAFLFQCSSIYTIENLKGFTV